MKLLAVHNNNTILTTLKEVATAFAPSPVICESADLETTLQLLGSDNDIGLVLVSMNLANTFCSTWMTAIRSHRVDIPVVFISDTAKAEIISQVVRENLVSCPFDSATGRLVLSAILKGLNNSVEGIESVNKGAKYFEQSAAYTMNGEFSNSQTNTAAVDIGDSRLTQRQREVLHLVQQGLSNKDIGRRLRLAEGTVKIHCLAIFRELGVTNRTQAAMKAEKFFAG